MGFYRDKRVLVAGGTGLIGRPLVEILLQEGAKVRVASLDDPSRAHFETEFFQTDMTEYPNCSMVCDGMDYVFNLLGVKSSPNIAREKPASCLEPVLLFNTNLIRAARKCGVERYLYTSSIGVYSPAEVFREEEVWKTFPSKNDWFPGWAKRVGELLVEASRVEYRWDNVTIVRPANVYGPYDNFESENAMVVPSLIKRIVNGENPLRVWGDGSAIRDLVHTRDVAGGIALIMEKNPALPVNLGSGKGYSIRELVEVILKNVDEVPKIEWDLSKARGDRIRVMDISRAKELGWSPKISLEDGVRETLEWYKENKKIADKRYDIFNR